MNGSACLDQKVVANILKDLSSAVAFLHDQGICHRDLKPDNIIYDPKSGVAKLIDFNIAKRFMQKSCRVSMRTCTGIDQWSAPETRIGCEYTEAVDLWGIGVVAYFIITGNAPFCGEIDIIKKIQECDYEPLQPETIQTYPEVAEAIK